MLDISILFIMSDMDERKNLGIRTAIEKVGGQVRLAQICGVSQPAVHHWLHHNCPAERAVDISNKTGVELTLIRPDLVPEKDA